MADIENLAARRADKSQDCRDWTPTDALRDALRAVESGAFEAEIVYVAFAGQHADGSRDYFYKAAGGTKLELIGLLARHLHFTNDG